MVSFALKRDYASSDEEVVDVKLTSKSSTQLSTVVIPTTPVKITAGRRYKVLANQVVTYATVEKIYQDGEGETYLVLTIDSPSRKLSDSLFSKTQTSTVTLSEFKLRLLEGGISEIVI